MIRLRMKTEKYINYNQFLNLSSHWRVNIEGEYTSDNQYFEDLTGNINSTSKTHLFRTIQSTRVLRTLAYEDGDG